VSSSIRPNRRAGAASPRDGEARRPLPRATFRELAGRAWHALGPVRGEPGDAAWVESLLTAPELALWKRQSPYDRRHAVEVAKRVEARLASTPYGRNSLWPAAALMHDVGKIEPDLSLAERAIATLTSKVIEVATARRWAALRGGSKRRIGLYLIHGEIGAGMIRTAGGREEIARWTEVHQGYQSLDGLAIPAAVVAALIECDVA
jgi:hypothetical protein